MFVEVGVFRDEWELSGSSWRIGNE